MTVFFVTATGTEVGKTFVTALLVRQLKATGAPVSALKPVISGFTDDSPAESDTAVLLESLDLPRDAMHIEQISPWRFDAPLSPDIAAAREGREIPFEELVGFCQRAAQTSKGTLLIEGVGGLMTPLTAEKTVLDWIKALGAPALLVAGSYLGTLSHTLTAVEAMRAHDLDIAGIVISESAQSPASLEETVAVLRRFLPHIPFAALPRLPPGEPCAPDLTYLAGTNHPRTG